MKIAGAIQVCTGATATERKKQQEQMRVLVNEFYTNVRDTSDKMRKQHLAELLALAVVRKQNGQF